MGFWAVALPGIADFIGFIGLNYVDQDSLPAPFTPTVEVGWRLGKRYATEGARACVQFGFEALGLTEIVAFAAALNKRSYKAME